MRVLAWFYTTDEAMVYIVSNGLDDAFVWHDIMTGRYEVCLP